MPYRSPQNWSSSGITTVAPASTACWNFVSTSVTVRWIVTGVREDGSVSIRPAGRRFGGGIVLPADYVAEHLDLGYAITAHRAQGVTTDTAHAVVTATTTRENCYVSMTRGATNNHAYVAVDREDAEHAVPRPGDNPNVTARSILYGVLQHIGAELSAHETIAAEQDRWGSIAQLAAEYDTIAQAAQHDRWATFLQASGLTVEQVEDVLASDAYGALSAELRHAEANHHDVAVLLPRLVASRSLHDAEDVAAVLHARLAAVTARPAGAGRARRARPQQPLGPARRLHAPDARRPAARLQVLGDHLAPAAPQPQSLRQHQQPLSPRGPRRLGQARGQDVGAGVVGDLARRGVEPGVQQQHLAHQPFGRGRHQRGFAHALRCGALQPTGPWHCRTGC